MMAVTSSAPASGTIWNVPNQVTAARVVLSVVLFVFLGLGWYLTSFVLFVVAASTDWVDGYYARRYGQITQLGRILDPFADKLIVCGTFIYLAAAPQSEVKAWMVVVIVGRELLVTTLRSFLEERGADFSAAFAGKLKMLLQCTAIGFSLFRLSYLDAESGSFATQPPQWMTTGLIVLVWAAVISTVYSGIGYIIAALRLLRR